MSSGAPKRSASKIRWVVMPAFVLFCAAVLLLWRLSVPYGKRLMDTETRNIENLLRDAGNSMTSVLNKQLAVLNGLAAFVEACESVESMRVIFPSFAEKLHTGVPGIRLLQIFPTEEPGLVYPESGGDETLPESPDVRDEVRRAVSSRRMTLSRPYMLRQGGKRLTARLALYRRGSLWGIASVIIDIDALLEFSGINYLTSGLDIAIQDHTGEVFSGSEEVFSRRQAVHIETIPDGSSWVFSALPRQGWESAVSRKMVLFRLAGLLAALIAAGGGGLAFWYFISLSGMARAKSRELEVVETKFSFVYKNSMEAILLTMSDGLILSANPAACRLFGHSEDELIRLGRSGVMDKEDPRLPELLREREEKGSARGELTLLKKDGTGFPAEITSALFLDETGRKHSSMIIRDITERKQAEKRAEDARAELGRLLEAAERSRRVLLSLVEDLRSSEMEIRKLNTELEVRVKDRTAQLESANREMEAFAYSVSHDLRTPLRAIEGFSRFLREDYEDKLDDEGKRLLGVIQDNTRKMDQLITDLLNLSRVTRGQLSNVRIDMKTLAEATYHEVASEEALRQFELKIDSLPDARGDANLLRQVWFNLLSNAVKYSAKSETKRIEIGSYMENDVPVYYVKDQGAGFDQRYADKLFGVFQRLHSSTDFEGTGVGLAVVQRIILRHNGRVWAEGRLDEGAAFYFTLPECGEAV